MSMISQSESRLLATQENLRDAITQATRQLKRFFCDNRGQDLVEYALIVAFAVGVVAVLTALYTTIKNILTKANSALQAAAQ